jgi:predicted enzyme related to lactoylglutathione lyase
MKSKIAGLTFDCNNHARQAEFWAAALGYIIEDVDDEDALVIDPSGVHPRLLFISVPEGKTAKNRIHFDLHPETGRQAEVERLVGLGATVIQHFDKEDGDVFTVMRDPEGNEFCVEGR